MSQCGIHGLLSVLDPFGCANNGCIWWYWCIGVSDTVYEIKRNGNGVVFFLTLAKGLGPHRTHANRRSPRVREENLGWGKGALRCEGKRPPKLRWESPQSGGMVACLSKSQFLGGQMRIDTRTFAIANLRLWFLSHVIDQNIINRPPFSCSSTFLPP